MKVIKDKEGNEYLLKFDLPARERVLAATGVDLLSTEPDAQTFHLMDGDWDKAANVLYFLLLPVLEEKGISQIDFLSSMNGDTIEDGVMTMYEELLDFFPRRMRPAFEEQIGLIKVMLEESEEAFQNLKMTDEFRAAMKQRIQQEGKNAKKQMAEYIRTGGKSADQPNCGSRVSTPSPANSE